MIVTRHKAPFSQALCGSIRHGHIRNIFVTSQSTCKNFVTEGNFANSVDENTTSRPRDRKLTHASSTQQPTPIYVSATHQHVGKTSTSLALLSGLQKRFDRVGFMKPVGQQSLRVVDNETGKFISVDKDAVLVKNHFNLHHLDYKHISPVLIPPGYTRNYLDGKICLEEQEHLVEKAFHAISSNSQIILCEGSGHCAVGSIVHASNAQVASWIGAKMILVANGGLGNTFDDLELNKALCDKEGVEICGVVVNKVLPEKLEQTRHYMEMALNMHWGPDIPLLGCIPDRPYLGCAALTDLERLFNKQLFTGQKHRLRHYAVQDINVVATSLEVFLQDLRTRPTRTLYVCHASRSDILMGFVMETYLRDDGVKDNEPALIMTGCDEHNLSSHILEIVKAGDAQASAPVMFVPQCTQKVMRLINSYTPKLNFEDANRAASTINHYEPYINFDLLLEKVGHKHLKQEKQQFA